MATELRRAIREAAREERLSCTRAFELADALGTQALAIGREATALGIRITHCQLGLFGHAETGKGRIVVSDPQAAADLAAAIHAALREGGLPCRKAWEIAQRTDRPRQDVANAAQALGIRVATCQLGCFR